MKIEEINKIAQKASEIKNQANNEVELYILYLDAQKLYNDAYNNCVDSEDISVIKKDFLSTIYQFESLDCQYAYMLKKEEFNKCQEICVKQIIEIDKILTKYKLEELEEHEIRDWYKYLVDHRISAEFKKYFPIGKSYFKKKNFKMALFNFRRAEEILISRNTNEMQNDYLLNYYLNFYILKLNISQCQAGIIETDIKEKVFLDRQIIKELLTSIRYAKEVMNISSDVYYKNGYNQIKELVKDRIIKSLNTWQTLYDYTQSDFLVDLMFEIDSNNAKSIKLSKFTHNPTKVDYFLFYTHGFNTRGAWKDKLTEVITNNMRSTHVNFILLPWDYGTFIFKFFIKSARNNAVRKFVNRYNEILDLYGDCECKCLVAHSFGTYITGTAIKENSKIICNKIILAGNILDVDYDWDYLKKNNQINEVLIEQSTNDGAVLFAKLFRKICYQKWIGFAGRDGFKNNYSFLRIIKSKSGHSGMLNKQNMTNKWVPFLIEKIQ